MAKGKPWDDILRAVMKGGKEAAETAGKKSKAKPKASVKPSVSKPKVSPTSAPGLSKADRRAANQAKAAAERSKRMAEGSARSAEARAARKVENRERAIAGDLREMRTDWSRGTQIKKAKEFFSDEIDKSLKVEGAVERLLVRGSGARRKFLERKVSQMKQYAKENGYTLSKSDVAAIVRSEDATLRKQLGRAQKRTEQVAGQAKFPKQGVEKGRKTGRKNPAEQETITTAARRQYRKDMRKGKVGGGSDEARARGRAAQQEAENKARKKSLQQADAGTGPARKPKEDSGKRTYRERGLPRYSEAQRYKDLPKKLRDEIEANAKKSQAGLSKAERDKRLTRFQREQEAMKKPRKPKAREFDRYGNRITPKGK